ALGWLVLQLSGSGSQLGIVLALQFLPQLLFGPWGGVIVDRFNKRSLIAWTQGILGVFAIGISILIFTDTIQMWMVYIIALAHGAIRVFDDPARQTFVSEMVDEAHLKNAVSLNATENNLARVAGPSIAGVLIASIGIAFCFLINGISYIAVVAMLFMMRKEELRTELPVEKKSGQLTEGFRYVMATPVIRNTLLMMAFIGTFAYEFQVSLPILAKSTFNGDAASYAALMTAMGVGAGLGGLYAAGRHKIAPHHLVIFAMLFGISIVATAFMPTLQLAIFGMFFVGAFSVNLLSLGQTMVQLESVYEMRGRVMGLWSAAMVGSTSIGGPIIGFIGEHAGGRWGLALGGLVTILTAGYAAFTLLKDDILQIIPESVQLRTESTPDVKL
ncbi:hypothetical protein A3A37_00840, partial [Candidatus Kaiserbacteria bacterium RIFCSPLOWO2_01_FULL_52_36]